ncbi:MAG: hypothetical protein QNJ15_08110 [Erythrobacter sp.]|nr:hypothetical protein [Erythrobacter sp.]
MKHRFAAILCIAALAQSQAALAQSVCVAPADLDDAIVYAMPLAYDAMQNVCAGEFASDGFMQSNGAGFAERFRDRQDAAWPGAFRMLKVFMAQPDEESANEDIMGLVSTLPESSLRPFVDAIVTQKLTEEIKPTSCGEIERALELISPLPVENISGLVTFVAQQAELKNPEICKPASEVVAN